MNGAILDPTGMYRYSLWRTVGNNNKKAAFIMLNPSTADEKIDDTTLKKCMYYAKTWGFGKLEVVNLFALRSTDPANLKLSVDPIGPENDIYLHAAVKSADRVFAAWGEKGILLGRDKTVLSMFPHTSIYALKMTTKGQPRHPLYLPNNIQPFLFK